MANEQERSEGTARFVEYTMATKVLGTVHHYKGVEPKTITKKADVREVFAFGLWYETGGGITYMLKVADVPNLEEQIKTKTLFDVAQNFLRLSAAQKNEYLTKAKSEFNWNSIKVEAKRLSEL